MSVELRSERPADADALTACFLAASDGSANAENEPDAICVLAGTIRK